MTLDRIFNSFIALGLLALSIGACNSSRATENNGIVENSYPMEEISTPEIIINRLVDYVVYSSIPECSRWSDTILIGEILSPGEIINTARDMDDLTKPDPHYFGITQIYEVQVERYVKGSGENIIYIGQHQGDLIIESNTPSVDEIEKARAMADYVPLSINQRLLMFLHKSHPEQFEEFSKGTLYFGGGYPWLFDLTDPECVQPINIPTNIKDFISAHFPPQPLTEILKQMDEPYDPSKRLEPTPYPPPETLDRCSGKPTEAYP